MKDYNKNNYYLALQEIYLLTKDNYKHVPQETIRKKYGLSAPFFPVTRNLFLDVKDEQARRIEGKWKTSPPTMTLVDQVCMKISQHQKNYKDQYKKNGKKKEEKERVSAEQGIPEENFPVDKNQLRIDVEAEKVTKEKEARSMYEDKMKNDNVALVKKDELDLALERILSIGGSVTRVLDDILLEYIESKKEDVNAQRTIRILGVTFSVAFVLIWIISKL